MELPVYISDAELIVQTISKFEQKCFSEIELIYVTPDYIVDLNQSYLNRDYITDIITFDLTDYNQNEDSTLSGSLYMCAKRIREQAVEWNEPERREFLRILIHGLLHLVGYNDKDSDTKTVMTQKENFYLSELEA